MTINLFMDDVQTFAAGTRIFSEGDAPGGLMYIVQEGEEVMQTMAERLRLYRDY